MNITAGRHPLALLAILLALTDVRAGALVEQTDEYGPFGVLHIYRQSDKPRRVVLFVSGDGGWNPGVIDMARALAALDSMVVGIDISHYIKSLNATVGGCDYAAAHFEALSQYLQKKYDFGHYGLPVVAGYSSGATMAYTTLAQSPPNTFAGAISLGFCPDLKTQRPFCPGIGKLQNKADRKLGFIYQPVHEELPTATKSDTLAVVVSGDGGMGWHRQANWRDAEQGRCSGSRSEFAAIFLGKEVAGNRGEGPCPHNDRLRRQMGSG